MIKENIYNYFHAAVLPKLISGGLYITDVEKFPEPTCGRTADRKAGV